MLRVGCIGAGYFSKFHHEAWARVEGAEPVAAVDRDLSRARATGLPAYEDPQEMLRRERPDIIDIITPPVTHLETIRAAMEQRPRVVICQKPFCQTLEEAKAAVALGAEAGIPLVIHENFRFQPWYRVIRQTINDGAIGDLLQVTFRFRPGDGQGPHAYLDRQPYFQKMQRFLVHETAVHWIDTFRFLMGKPNAVFAELRQLNPAIAGEDAGFILFSYDDGRRALFDGNRLLDHSARDTRCTMGEALVEGTTGSLHLSGDGSVACRRFGEEAFAELYRPDNVQGFGGDCVFHLCKHVVDGLNGRTEFENEAHDYLFTLRVEEAVYRSAELGKMIKVG